MVSREHSPEYKGRSTNGSPDEQQVDDKQTEAEEHEDAPIEQDVLQYSGPKEVLYGSEAEKFNNPEAILWVFEILKRRWEESWMYWGDITHDEREKQWNYFLRRYTYTDKHQGNLLRRTWEATLQCHVTQILSQAHEVAKMEAGSEDISTWVDSHPNGIAKYVWLEMRDKLNIDAQKDKSQATHSNRLVEGGLTNHNNDSIPFITDFNCMPTSQGKLPTQAELCNKTDREDSEELIDACLREVMDDYTTSSTERFGDSIQGGVDLDTWLKAAADSREDQLYRFTPIDAHSNFSKNTNVLQIHDSPRIQSRTKLSQQQMKKIEQAVEIMLKYALNSFSDRLTPHIAKQIHDSLRGKGPKTPKDDGDEDDE